MQVTAPFTYAANDTHTCEVSWHDSVTTRSIPVNRVCNQTHTFISAGMYTIDVAVTDDDGGTGTAQVMVVLYDLDGGFVTNGGVITSPAGAFPCTPDNRQTDHPGDRSSICRGGTGPAPGSGRIAADLEGGEMRLESTGNPMARRRAEREAGRQGRRHGWAVRLVSGSSSTCAHDPDGLRLGRLQAPRHHHSQQPDRLRQPAEQAPTLTSPA